MKVIVAFYKAYGKQATLGDRIISWWTKGPYDHVEVLVFQEQHKKWIQYSATAKEGKVRCKPHTFNTDIWDYVLVEVDNANRIVDFYKEICEEKYDFNGIIFSQILPLGVDKNNKWFCSESVTKALILAGINNKELWLFKPEMVHPNKLALILGMVKYLDKSLLKTIGNLFANNEVKQKAVMDTFINKGMINIEKTKEAYIYAKERCLHG